MLTIKPLNIHTRHTFVRHGVKEILKTTEIIDAVMPYFPKSCICIAGYLNDEDQFWKVNYHWEYLLTMVDKALHDELTKGQRGRVDKIRATLMVNPPKPQTGYTKSKEVGKPVDASDHTIIMARWKVLKQCKRDFKAVIEEAKLIPADKKSAVPWHLAVAPVAAPGTSKHGSGYALDISGDNAEIRRIAHALDASLVFDEKSHVHCEFKRGAKK